MARTVSQELALMRKLQDEIDAVRQEMRPFERKLDRLINQFHSAQKRARCRKVPGCRGLRNHLGCHNV